jgi:hypothetical protein
MKGVLPWLVSWAHRAGTGDFCPALAALVSPLQNIFPSQQSGQALMLCRLSRNKCFCQIGLKYTEHKPFGRHYLSATRTTMSSAAVHTLTQAKPRFSILAVVVYS